MLIARHVFVNGFTLIDPDIIDQIISFPEHGMGYSLVDVTLKDGTLVEQVVICNGNTVCFYDDMRQFSEDEITSVAVSQI